MEDGIKESIKKYILDEFLPGEDLNNLTDDTPLISGGILDSISTLKLVMFIEERFSITLAAHEADKEHLDTITDIVRLVSAKKS
jgi:acyl carrier protein